MFIPPKNLDFAMYECVLKFISCSFTCQEKKCLSNFVLSRLATMVLLMIYVNPISLFLHTFVGMLRNHCTSKPWLRLIVADEKL